MRHWTYLPIVGFSLVFASAGPARASDEAYAVEAVPCPVKLPQENEIEGKTYDCSVVLVPEDHADPESRTIELAMMRLRAATLSPAGDPLIYLSGGPGSSALHEISSNALLYLNMQAMRERRDLLFYDQRGTGHSHLLACGPFNSAIGVVGELYADKGIDIAQLEQISQSGFGNTLTLIACATGYQSAGVDLAQFNSVASAKDIAAVAQAMGYQGEYNLYGTSYGTRLALNALRSTPDKIRAVILDGTAGPSMPNNAYTTAKIQDQYDSFFAQCRASDLCNMRYPNLRDRFISVLKDLKARPLVFSEPVVTSDYLRPFLGVLEKIDPAFFADMGRITNVAAQGGYVGVLPAIIAALENREERALRKLLGGGVLPPAAPIDQIASADDVLAADDMFLQTAIDVVLARAKAETDESSLSDQWASLVINELDSRLRGGETQATVIRDLVELTLVPIKGTDAAALNEFARSHLSDLSATKAEALVGGMDRQQVRETMWAIQDVAAVLLGVGERSGALGVATGAMFAVNCAEDISLVPEEVAAEYMAASPYPGVFVNSLKDYRGSRIACSFFPTPFTREEMMTPVKSVKPALIFQEGLDSQTPLTFGKKVAANLPNSFFLEWPSEGHVIATRSRDGCAGDIAAAFMDRPDQQPDFGCSKDPYYSIQFEMAFGKVDEMLAQPD